MCRLVTEDSLESNLLDEERSWRRLLVRPGEVLPGVEPTNVTLVP